MIPVSSRSRSCLSCSGEDSGHELASLRNAWHSLRERVSGAAAKPPYSPHEWSPRTIRFTASLPKQNHSRAKSRQLLDSSPILSASPRVHGFATKTEGISFLEKKQDPTEALAREIPPATQAMRGRHGGWYLCLRFAPVVHIICNFFTILMGLFSGATKRNQEKR